MFEKLQTAALMLVAKKDEKGATATEYALLVALIAIVIVVAVTAFGSNLNAFFQSIADTVSSW